MRRSIRTHDEFSIAMCIACVAPTTQPQGLLVRPIKPDAPRQPEFDGDASGVILGLGIVIHHATPACCRNALHVDDVSAAAIADVIEEYEALASRACGLQRGLELRARA